MPTASLRRDRPVRTVVFVGLLALSPAPLAALSQAEHVADSIAHAILAEPDYIGLALAVGRDDEVVLSRGYGIAIRARSVKADANTQYRVYSVVKPMTAVLAARLAERGVLDLDAPVSTFLSEVPAATGELTVRQLIATWVAFAIIGKANGFP